MSGLRRRAARSTDGNSGRWRSQGRGHDLRHGERSSRSIHNNHERHAYGDDHNAAKQQDPFGLHRRAQDGGQMMGTMPAVGMSGKPAPRQPSRPPALIRYIGAARCAGAPATLPPSASRYRPHRHTFVKQKHRTCRLVVNGLSGRQRGRPMAI